MRVHWTDRAKSRLRIIHHDLGEHSPELAKKTVQRLIVRSTQLGEHPYLGHKLLDYERDDLREVLERPYRIIYRVDTYQIDVITVLHYRQLLSNDLANSSNN